MLSGWGIAALVFVGVLVWIAIGYALTLKDRARYRALLAEIFEGSDVPAPRLEAGFSYSYPSLRLYFGNEAEHEQAGAEGLDKAFRDEIQAMHSNIRDFDADLAVYFTWENRPPPPVITLAPDEEA